MPMNSDLAELVLNRTWRPTLSVTGVEGMPKLEDAGNVLRPYTAVKLSVRIPPALDPVLASNKLKEILENGSAVRRQDRVRHREVLAGLGGAVAGAVAGRYRRYRVQDWFGTKSAQMGEGGTIPFMGMLQVRFPEAQFVVTGLLGPKSNAHGPNEFLHIPTRQADRGDVQGHRRPLRQPRLADGRLMRTLALCVLLGGRVAGAGGTAHRDRCRSACRCEGQRRGRGCRRVR